MYYYHMTALDHLSSIAVQGLILKNGDNGKLIKEEKIKVFFSEGFEGAVALYVDFDIVFNKIRKGEMKPADEFVRKKLLQAESLSDFLAKEFICGLTEPGSGMKEILKMAVRI